MGDEALKVDILSPEERSKRMAQIGARNTKPEMAVRRMVHSMGFRYRLHDHKLPGKPDLVFSKRRKIIFVHGCFWHRHVDPACPMGRRMPKSRSDYWMPKFARTVQRDARSISALEQSGWQCLVVWECQISDGEQLRNVLRSFLKGGK